MVENERSGVEVKTGNVANDFKKKFYLEKCKLHLVSTYVNYNNKLNSMQF